MAFMSFFPIVVSFISLANSSLTRESRYGVKDSEADNWCDHLVIGNSFVYPIVIHL